MNNNNNKQIDQINILKDLISTAKKQVSLMEDEVKRLEESLPKLIVTFSDGIEYKFSNYTSCYKDNTLSLHKIYSCACRRELLYILFDNETGSDTYNYIYGDGIMTMKQGYELMRLLKGIYSAALNTTEKERIKMVYDKVLAKNMYIADFINCDGNPTKEIVKKLQLFIDVIDKCVIVRSCLSSDLTALHYLLISKLPHKDVYDIILEKLKKWMGDQYTCLYSITE